MAEQGRRLEGRRALVTGGGSGIGRATARRFVEEGVSHVAVVDLRPDRLDVVERELTALGATVVGICCDLGDLAAAARCVEEAAGAFGGLEIVVANAGLVVPKPFMEHTVEDWQRVFAVNLFSYVVIGQAAARHMIEAGRGGAILFTSAAVQRGGSTGQSSAYGASKTAVVAMATGMAVSLAPYGIRVNCVAPGAVDTNLASDRLGEEEGARAKARSADGLAIGRIGRPEELAAMFAFLASDDASYVSGGNYWVDGGWLGPSTPAPAPSPSPPPPSEGGP